MPTCLHCGENAPPGALFCTKCGYTLPQGVPAAPGAPVIGTAGPAPPVVPARGYPVIVPTGPYLVPAASLPGAVGPVPPPPNAKYCTRCGTAIAQPAVYCPVCQQPQP